MWPRRGRSSRGEGASANPKSVVRFWHSLRDPCSNISSSSIGDIMSNTTSPEAPTAVPVNGLTTALSVFDSADSKETIIYLSIALLALLGIGLALKAIYWVSDKFRYPGWQIWSVTTRQRLAIIWTTSTLSLFVVCICLPCLISIYLTFLHEFHRKN